MRSAIGAVGHAPWLAPVFERPHLRRLLERLPGGRSLYATGWDRRHPFDRLNGTTTSGMVPPEDLDDAVPTLHGAHCYAGSQPGVLRAVLGALPALDGYSFIDLGCGKGRALFVAAEFPFRVIIGVDLSPWLSRIAEDNAAIVQRRHPRRVPPQIVTGDATTHPLPAGDVVLLLYNPFGKALIEKVVRGVEAALAAHHRRLYVVYYNPVFGECFDASPQLRRCYAKTVPYAKEELGFGPDTADVVVVWEPGEGPPRAGAEGRIVVTLAEQRCELVAP